MIILKWYSIVLMIICFMHDLYKEGQDDAGFWLVMITILVELPLIIYLILS